jgi:nitrate reductase delta subunit
MRLYRLLSALLDYPADDLRGELAEAVAGQGAAAFVDSLDPDCHFSREERAETARFIEALLAADATERQAAYVQTFDLVPGHSLHLTHHLFGEEKTRGPALVDLAEFYKSYGVAHDEHELPDFLPLMLEFVAYLEPEEASVFLGDAAKVLNVLAGNLEAAASPYAPLLRIVENHGSLARLAA